MHNVSSSSRGTNYLSCRGYPNIPKLRYRTAANVSYHTLDDRMNGQTPLSKFRLASHTLTELEEQFIV